MSLEAILTKNRNKDSLLPATSKPKVSDSTDQREVDQVVSTKIDRRKTNLIKFLYWTYLQLERFVTLLSKVMPCHLLIIQRHS